MSVEPETGTDTKDRLLDAAERLFARDGIYGARVREINELAGQRNQSALHYHFGSRLGLVEAILLRFQGDVDAHAERRLDELEHNSREFTIRQVVESVVPPLVDKLGTPSGRDCARIIPQILPNLSRNLRRGVMYPATPQSQRILLLLDERMTVLAVPDHLRRERLVTYSVVLVTLLAERAHQLEALPEPLLDPAEFTSHLVGVCDATLTAPVR